jgi:hypothetical protein
VAGGQRRVGRDSGGVERTGTVEPTVSSNRPAIVGRPALVAQFRGREANIVKAALHFRPRNSPSVTVPLTAATLRSASTDTTELKDIVLVRPLFQTTFRVPEYLPETQESRPVAWKVDHAAVMFGSALEAHRVRVDVP